MLTAPRRLLPPPDPGPVDRPDAGPELAPGATMVGSMVAATPVDATVLDPRVWGRRSPQPAGSLVQWLNATWGRWTANSNFLRTLVIPSPPGDGATPAGGAQQLAPLPQVTTITRPRCGAPYPTLGGMSPVVPNTPPAQVRPLRSTLTEYAQQQAARGPLTPYVPAAPCPCGGGPGPCNC